MILRFYSDAILALLNGHYVTKFLIYLIPFTKYCYADVAFVLLYSQQYEIQITKR